MGDLFTHAKIENLPIKFATSYKAMEGGTLRDVDRLSGDLAEAIAQARTIRSFLRMRSWFLLIRGWTGFPLCL